MKSSRIYENCISGKKDCSELIYDFTLHDVISQFKDSPKLKGYIMSFISIALQNIDESRALSKALGIDCVSGDMLDLIGEIIVQPRPYIGIDEPWFSVEDNNPTDPLSAGFNEGKFWDGKSPLLGKTKASDDIYRIFLKSKIAKNVSSGTHNDLAFVVSYISCRDDIAIHGTNGYLLSYPYALYEADQHDTRGLDEGVWGLQQPVDVENMVIVLKGTEKPIDTFLVALFTQFDILPIPAGVRLIVDQS